MPLTLFACYLGGTVPGCNLEAHDIRFCVGNTIEDCYPHLQAAWFGEKKGLHLDAYAALNQVDGYKITITPHHETLDTHLLEATPNLYFINLGGYRTGKLMEYHETGFYVANHPAEAKQKAKKAFHNQLDLLHKDDLLAVDECLCVAEHLSGYRLALTPLAEAETLPLPITCGYFVIPESLSQLQTV